MKKIEFSINDNVNYYLLELYNDNAIKNKSVDWQLNKMTESMFNDFLDELIFENEKYNIIDFSNIYSVDIKLSHYKKVINNKNILINMNKKIFEAFKGKGGEEQEVLFQESSNSEYVMFFDDKSNGKQDKEFIDMLCMRLGNEEYWREELGSLHKNIIGKIISEILMTDIERYEEGEYKYLESSNVYVNCYLNIKRLFMHVNVLRLTINEMKNYINKYFLDEIEQKNRDKIYLLGVSNNGIILSRILAYVMKMKAKGINHIGPKYCLNSDNGLAEEINNKKYILISDVICLGGEYRIAKGIMGILDSELLGAVSIVKIKDIYREGDANGDKIYALIDDINKYGCEYKIFIDKESTDGQGNESI